jgi:histidinol-phosphate aminotransferase
VIRLSPRLRALRPYTAADLLDGELRVRAHRNEAPLPPPQHVVDAIRNVDGDALRHYPADLQRRVLHQLASRLGVGARHTAIANGADEIILAAARVTLDPGDNAVTVRPTFGMYKRAVAMCGAVVREVPYRRRWQLDLDALVTNVDHNTQLVYLGHPNNPTGEPLPIAMLERLARAIPETLIVVDEVYLALRAESLVGAAHALPNVVVAGSLSKVCALAGLRVGFATGDPAVISAFRGVLAPYAISVTSLLAAQAYLCDGAAARAFERAIALEVQRSLDAIARALTPFATSLWRGLGTFLLADLGSEVAPIVKRLRRRGIAVRVFPTGDLCTCIRICALDEGSTVELVTALNEVLPAFLPMRAHAQLASA